MSTAVRETPSCFCTVIQRPPTCGATSYLTLSALGGVWRQILSGWETPVRARMGPTGLSTTHDTWTNGSTRLALTKTSLVVHDWGSALGFHWAHRHQDRIKAIVYMEAIVRPLTWEEWPEQSRRIFQGMRSPDGEGMVLDRNLFVERILPGSVLRGLTEEEIDVYRRPYLEPGESRRPTLTWPREIPIDGQPTDVVGIVEGYSQWLAMSPLPKLFINGDPGAILVGTQREFCRSWPNQIEVTVPGRHFLQEDSPDQIGEAIAEWYRSL